MPDKSSNPPAPVSGEGTFVLNQPPWIIISKKDSKFDQKEGRVDLLEGMTVTATQVGNDQAIPMFSNKQLAEAFAAKQGPDHVAMRPHSKEAMLNFLQIMQTGKCKFAVFDLSGPGASIPSNHVVDIGHMIQTFTAMPSW